MYKIPITIEKIKVKDYQGREAAEYLMTIKDKGSTFDKVIRCDRDKLVKFKEHLDSILADTTTAEILKIAEEDARKVDKAHVSDPLCKGCEYKMTYNCVTCLFQLQSPLERKLFLKLKKASIKFEPQYGLNWRGENISVHKRSYDHPEYNFKEVLTVADFFVRERDLKLCIYTDGHTYHERTEDQAQRDRKIDRKLQELGYQVLRYTGKDVNQSVDKVILDIQNWISKAR